MTEIIFGRGESGEKFYLRTKKSFPENYWNLEVWIFSFVFKFRSDKLDKEHKLGTKYECRLCGEKFDIVK